jgi:hypothetical protein
MVFPGHNRLTIRINETGSVIWSAGLPSSTPQSKKRWVSADTPGLPLIPLSLPAHLNGNHDRYAMAFRQTTTLSCGGC